MPHLHILERESRGAEIPVLSAEPLVDAIVEFLANHLAESSRRLSRWRPSSDHTTRWLTSGLVTVEEGVLRMLRYRDSAVGSADIPVDTADGIPLGWIS